VNSIDFHDFYNFLCFSPFFRLILLIFFLLLSSFVFGWDFSSMIISFNLKTAQKRAKPFLINFASAKEKYDSEVIIIQQPFHFGLDNILYILLYWQIIPGRTATVQL